ncbi:MAG: MarR family transcriptional regulator [bacterium]|nr:MarR family transcriptional regulator [bacterium]
MGDNDYYTLKGYEKKEHNELSYAMEDYLEMICRACCSNKYVRVNDLAERLNVRPSSVSKMVNRLKDAEYVDFEPYGIIKPTVKGWGIGRYFLYRHNVINEFFQVVNETEDELEIAEKIEHYLDRRTVLNMQKLIPAIQEINNESGTR